MFYHEFHYVLMHICRSFLRVQNGHVRYVEKEADLFLILSSLLFLKQLAILLLRVYFILNKINNHAV